MALTELRRNRGDEEPTSLHDGVDRGVLVPADQRDSSPGLPPTLPRIIWQRPFSRFLRFQTGVFVPSRAQAGLKSV